MTSQSSLKPNNLDINEFLRKISSVRSQDEVIDVFHNTVSEFGFDIVIHTFLTDHLSLNKKISDLYVGPAVQGWGAYYTENEYLKIDPIREALKYKNGISAWSDIAREKKLSTVQKRFMSELREAKVWNGFSVPIHGPNNEISAVSFASSQSVGKIEEQTLLALGVMSRQCDEAYKNFLRQNTIEYRVHLTAREKEVLKWAAAGKSNYDIAQIVCLSEDGVKYHFKNIYSKLGVSSRSAALVKALKFGLVDI
jgi:DNA-binding CsgD family transcriptional regulator